LTVDVDYTLPAIALVCVECNFSAPKHENEEIFEALDKVVAFMMPDQMLTGQGVVKAKAVDHFAALLRPLARWDKKNNGRQ